MTVTVVDGTATGGVDYKAFPKPKKVTFKAGQVQKTLTVTGFADLVDEPDENIIGSITASAAADPVDREFGGHLPPQRRRCRGV